MKLILFIDSLTNGGSQRQLVDLAIGLRERNHEVTVITYWPLNFHLSRLQRAGVAFECLHKSSRFDLRPVFKLHGAIRKLGADVVVAFLRTPSFYAVVAGLFSPGTGVVVSERAGITRQGLGWEHYISGLSYTFADQITGNSYHYLQALCKKLPWLKRKSTVVYNGVDPRFFSAASRRLLPASASNKHTVADRRASTVKICVVASRVSVEKGQLQLVHAATLLADRTSKPFSIHWVGLTEPRNDIVIESKKLIEQKSLNDKWYWEGQVNDIASVYPEYDALVLPSLHEGVANALCEAMASGLPIVATKIADNARIVKQGVQGFLCLPDDPDSLAEALQLLVESTPEQRLKMGKNSHAMAKVLFSQSGSLNNWEKVLSKACR